MVYDTVFTTSPGAVPLTKHQGLTTSCLCQLRSTAIFGQDHVLQPTQRSQETLREARSLEKVDPQKERDFSCFRKRNQGIIPQNPARFQEFSWYLLLMKLMNDGWCEKNPWVCPMERRAQELWHLESGWNVGNDPTPHSRTSMASEQFEIWVHLWTSCERRLESEFIAPKIWFDHRFPQTSRFLSAGFPIFGHAQLWHQENILGISFLGDHLEGVWKNLKCWLFQDMVWKLQA